MSGFVSATCNLSRREITVWRLQYGRNQALRSVDIALLDRTDALVALDSMQHNCSAVSSVMISDSSPDLSGVERS